MVTWRKKWLRMFLFVKITEILFSSLTPADYKIWRVVELKEQWTHFRVGDLNNDGIPEMLFVEKTAFLPSEIKHPSVTGFVSKLIAYDLVDERILWQRGTSPQKKQDRLNDIAMEIADFDGDGKNEVICLWEDREILLLAGEDGRVIKQRRLPPQCQTLIYNLTVFEQKKGEKSFVLNGLSQLWAFDKNLNQQWHYVIRGWTDGGCLKPYPYDVNQDGEDEIFCGTVMLNGRGEEYWRISPAQQNGVWYYRGTDFPYFWEHIDNMVVAEIDGNLKNGPEVALTDCGPNWWLLDAKTGLLRNEIIPSAGLKPTCQFYWVPLNTLFKKNFFKYFGEELINQNLLPGLIAEEKKWDFEKEEEIKNFNFLGITSVSIEKGKLKIASKTTDPYLIFPDYLNVKGAEFGWIELKMKVNSAGFSEFHPVSERGEIFFITTQDFIYDERKKKMFFLKEGGKWQTYLIPMKFTPSGDSFSLWQNSTIRQVRLDPVCRAKAEIEIDYLKVVKLNFIDQLLKNYPFQNSISLKKDLKESAKSKNFLERERFFDLIENPALPGWTDLLKKWRKYCWEIRKVLLEKFDILTVDSFCTRLSNRLRERFESPLPFHLQHLTVGNFTKDPGLEIMLSSGDLYTGRGEHLSHQCGLHSFIINNSLEIDTHGGIVPVNWRGNGIEDFVFVWERFEEIDNRIYNARGKVIENIPGKILAKDKPGFYQLYSCYPWNLKGDGRDELIFVAQGGTIVILENAALPPSPCYKKFRKTFTTDPTNIVPYAPLIIEKKEK